jgi:hypothetical protein
MARIAHESRVEEMTLWAWSEREAKAVAEARRVLAEQIQAQADATAALESTAEWAQLEMLKSALKAAKKAAGVDLVVADAQAEVRKARKIVKGLKAAQDAKRAREEAKATGEAVEQRERDLAAALARGEAPAGAGRTT